MKKVFIVTAVIAVFIGVPCLAPAAIRGTCQGGLNDGQACGSDADCTGGICRLPEIACTSTNCRSTSWVAHSTGYERRTRRYCSTATQCTSVTQYRCAAGYYGRSLSGSTGCTPCPENGVSVPPDGDLVGFTAVTDCFIPSGTEITDSTGTYTYTNDCYYTE